jgi:hypothetical protein
MKPHDRLHANFLSFEATHGLYLPEDLKTHFLAGKVANDEYNNDLFCFYSFASFHTVDDKLGNWRGTPDYSNIVNTMEESKRCYVFADYMFHLFAYAIRLHKEPAEQNVVYAICGDKYKEIAGSFTEFMAWYATDISELQF